MDDGCQKGAGNGQGDSTFNQDLFRAKLAFSNLNVTSLAQIIGLSKDALYRRLKNNTENLRLGDIRRIANALNLSAQDICRIFFTKKAERLVLPS